MANVELITRILKQVEGDSDSLEMSDWVTYADDEDDCGTVACVAGWAAILSGRAERTTGVWIVDGYSTKERPSWREAGQAALSIGNPLTDKLFFTDRDSALWALRALLRGVSEEDVLQGILNEDEAL